MWIQSQFLRILLLSGLACGKTNKQTNQKKKKKHSNEDGFQRNLAQSRS